MKPVACLIWKEGRELWIEFPGENRSHTIHFPISEAGFALLVRILTDREVAPAKSKIATPAAPHMALIREALKEKRLADEAAEAELKELGL